MLKQWGLAAAISVLAVMPAWAQSNSCGDEPIPPAIPSVADMGQKAPADAQKAKHQAFEDIRAWQASLKDFRDCLDSDQDTTKRQLQDASAQNKPDQDKLSKLRAEIDTDGAANMHSTDTEERLVNDFHALSTAYCARSDVDKTSCPKS